MQQTAVRRPGPPDDRSGASRTGLDFTLDVNDGGGILNPGGIARPAIKAAIACPKGSRSTPPWLGPRHLHRSRLRPRERVPPTRRRLPNASKVGDVSVEGMLGSPEP